jgi:hypothetical protein
MIAQGHLVRADAFPRHCSASQAAGGLSKGSPEPVKEVEVWLRVPPFIDLWAARAYELVDVRGESYRSAAAIMNREDGLNINSGKVWQLRQRCGVEWGNTDALASSSACRGHSL